jgi:DNA-binding NarL/FixJ family response regulator
MDLGRIYDSQPQILFRNGLEHILSAEPSFQIIGSVDFNNGVEHVLEKMPRIPPLSMSMARRTSASTLRRGSSTAFPTSVSSSSPPIPVTSSFSSR